MGNATFKDGDEPRKTMDILTGPSSGYAYYLASKPGYCSECARHTSRWLVTVKTEGKYLCLECNRKEKQKKEQISEPVYLFP